MTAVKHVMDDLCEGNGDNTEIKKIKVEQPMKQDTPTTGDQHTPPRGITNVKLLSSYNCIDGEERTIVVPGEKVPHYRAFAHPTAGASRVQAPYSRFL
jgi:hypothetical protein